ncbi:hypothetical protein A2363_00785 [Candidatus Gottesmanbacteria bacterium RIFOXYB1_FULL_47_11]|uniref:Four helix bundle protein n=1 Tax=Candidatus Gottesmanbacteria bacterium RIFOXYB1_FULL_47_11 TaxID=1798401 RepID=A0A1F6BGE2_9BACT|nr:MAG: hypothetical protein A2363_00785 [Candidatus Gottesmanbacteria bacterium RIFOXYB1_FULL_47_11]
MYSEYIIQHTSNSNYSVTNQRDLVLDTAQNLTQIGHWAKCSLAKDEQRIALFLKLTRKNLNALSGFPLSPKFNREFQLFCVSFTALEAEYCAGLTKPAVWASGVLTWASTLTQSASLL